MIKRKSKGWLEYIIEVEISLFLVDLGQYFMKDLRTNSELLWRLL